ncbi:MAG: cation:proton antiporter subunit C [Candidatus Thermoplasmatota archaeon]|jgi:multicomponent Na+:H+ antiporter subunit C|nr:cation:proton antiporter subunit C [Candidatus Thermoplasmatota archaeon]
MIYNIPFIAVVAMIFIGLYAVVFRRNLIKMVIGITIIECGVNLFLITLGYREGGVAPIYTSLPEGTQYPSEMVLPVPQALTLTSIVIGVAVLALMLSLVMHIYKQYGTLDVRKIRRLKE